MVRCIACLLLAATLFQTTGSVAIWIVFGGDLVFSQEFSPRQTIFNLKQQISFRVGLCPDFIQIIDIYENTQQEEDGYGEFMDHKTLKDYCITDDNKGKILYAIRRVIINDLIIPLKTFATVAYLGSVAMKLPLRGSQTILEFKQSMAIYLSIRNISTVLLRGWYSNSYVDEDGGWPLDNRSLSYYGWDSGHKGVILYLGCEVSNDFHGTATIFYGNGMIQNNVPFLDTQTVLEFKQFLFQITSIPVREQIIFEYPENKAQNADGGVWNDYKTLLDYNLRTGEAASLCIGQRV